MRRGSEQSGISRDSLSRGPIEQPADQGHTRHSDRGSKSEQAHDPVSSGERKPIGGLVPNDGRHETGGMRIPRAPSHFAADAKRSGPPADDPL
jgi:hypothetical protein